ncbi:hypothetical protein J3B02_002299 [Coemansia erecta]|uniref:Protein kinase domain-containing protein n=1 Tax=Coemansia asiatica TaxID=1052880 RepID=A0A9W7XEX4_9FUNG|nr:hypothetical protein LPJ64_006246 [Coemansia asiatica]KAJ2855184.1 hypothetical protein J3B02_002299 [Coemansia erecta]KAJ2880675.1 hypothetical protein FB639_002781 [Coemansia asiatica]
MDREISLYGRVAYIATGEFDGEAAVLKLSWTSVDRLPENAAYEILLRDGVEGISAIFKRGLLIEDFGGFRLEYTIMEFCGEPFSKTILAIQDKRDDDTFTKAVKSIVNQTTACLVNAFASGIVHRDISDGNIAVQYDYYDDEAYARIIDWGYAKDSIFKSKESVEVGEKWCYDSAKVGKNEEEHDPFTGTPRYMSISTLFGASFRNVMADIESIFMLYSTHCGRSISSVA